MLRPLRRLYGLVRYSLVPAIIHVLWLPAQFGTWFVTSFVRGFIWWWENRRLRNLLYGLPALVVLVASGYFAAAAVTRSKSALCDRYIAAGRRAIGTKAYEAARLYFERAVELQPRDLESMWSLAVAAEQTKDYPRLHAVMQELAPEDRPVYAPAHLVQAMSWLSRADQPFAYEHVRRQLQHALTLIPDHPDALLVLGDVELKSGNYRAAAEHLNKIATAVPDARLSLSIALKHLGDDAGAERWARSAEEHWTAAHANNADDPLVAVKLAESQRFLENFSSAAATLERFLSRKQPLTPELSDLVHQTLARVLVNWAEPRPGESATDRLQARFQLLSAALLANPYDLAVFDRMMTLLKSGGDVANQARDFLLNNITQGKAVGMSHLLLGSQAFLALKPEEAELHLQLALDGLPNAPIVANNLAWFLAHRDPPDAQRALELIEPVIKRFPNDLRFIDTRGHILIKLGRYREGVDDIEKALPLLGGSEQTHLALATAYDALGHQDLAARHRELSGKSQAPTERTLELPGAEKP